jgi:repressor LexA
MAEHLFEKRSEILRYLARRSDDAGAPPSVREIGRAVGLKSAQTVHHHLGRPEADGYVERLSGRTRTPVLTEKGWGAVGDDMPLLGWIAAGRGLEAVTMGDEAFSLTSELLFSPSGKRRYTLRVQENSMTGARIDDGDLLVVEEDEDPPDGAVVVALLEGEEVTVKRLHREGRYVRLKPENGDHEDIVVPAGEVRVQGRVVYVVHPPKSA